MPITAEGIRELMELGIAGDQLLAVVAIFERDAERSKPVVGSNPGKDSDRERSQRYRDNRKRNGMKTYFRGDLYRAALMKRDGADCIYCGSEPGVCVDHMMPVSKGGTDDEDNLGLACTPCNSRKAGRTPNEARMSFASRSAEESFNRYLAAITRADGARLAANDGANASALFSLTEEEKKKAIQGGKEVEKKERRRRARELPADFQPKLSHFEKAREFGRDDQFVRDKFEDMRIWAQSNGALKVDWDQTLHGFIRRDAKQEARNGNGTGNYRADRAARPTAAGSDAILAGMGRIADRIHDRRVSTGPRGPLSRGDDDSPILDLEPVGKTGD